MQEGLSLDLKCLWWWQPLFYVCTPIVEINGQAQKAKWGENFFPLPPGTYFVRIFFAYLVQKECGLAITEETVLSGQQTRLIYKPPFSVLQQGNIEVQG